MLLFVVYMTYIDLSPFFFAGGGGEFGHMIQALLRLSYEYEEPYTLLLPVIYKQTKRLLKTCEAKSPVFLLSPALPPAVPVQQPGREDRGFGRYAGSLRSPRYFADVLTKTCGNSSGGLVRHAIHSQKLNKYIYIYFEVFILKTWISLYIKNVLYTCINRGPLYLFANGHFPGIVSTVIDVYKARPMYVHFIVYAQEERVVCVRLSLVLFFIFLRDLTPFTPQLQKSPEQFSTSENTSKKAKQK